jgi:two-component system, cell cycle sensor histidine kinase and response regulator CckA
MTERDPLLSGTLHDLNNLLTVIAGHGELMLRRIAQTDPLWRNVDAIRKAAESGSALTHQMLASTRQIDLPRDEVDVNELVIDVLGMLEAQVTGKVEVRTALAERLGRVHASRAQIEQVIVNLVMNAIEAMPGGGTLTVETAPADAGDRPGGYPPSATSRGGHVRVTVRDTGRGIEPWVRARLFQPYFTTKEGKGTGLGLATANVIVARHGGALTVASAPGQGASFNVYLPRVADSDDTDAAEDTRYTVVAIEDEPELRQLIQEILELHGYTVLVAPDAHEGLALAERHPGRIDLVITDVILPGMSLHTFRQALDRARPDVRVLYVSAHTDDEIARRVKGQPAPVLRKPFAVGALAAKVREALDAAR